MRLIVHAGIDDGAQVDVRLVLFALFDGTFVAVKVGVIGKALHGLFDQVAVRHGVADADDLVAHVAQDAHHTPRRLAFACPGAHGADGDDGLGRLDHRRVAAHQTKVRAGCQRDGGLVHHDLMRHVAVSKDHLVNLQVADQFDQVGFGENLDAFGIELAGQLRRVQASLDVGDLRRGERHHFIVGVVAKVDVEVVKVAPGGSHDEHTSLGHFRFSFDLADLRGFPRNLEGLVADSDVRRQTGQDSWQSRIANIGPVAARMFHSSFSTNRPLRFACSGPE